MSGCSVIQKHNIDENGYVSFVNTINLSEEASEQEGTPEEQESKKQEFCKNTLSEWDKDVTDRGCKVDGKGIITLSGKYKINSGNFIKKDGYILFNAKELNNAKDKLSKGDKKSSPAIGDADEAAKSGIEDIYMFTLPGEPVNYTENTKLNSFMIFNDKDYFFVSKIGEGGNPFKDKLTEENSRNIESLKYFPELVTGDAAVNNIGNELVNNAQKTKTPLITNTSKKKEENLKKNIEKPVTQAPVHQDGETLPSTGTQSIAEKIIDSIINFFSKLF